MNIENIHQIRVAKQIDDADLQEAIRWLIPGDYVRITLVDDDVMENDPFPGGECIWVQITSVQDGVFRAELVNCPILFGPEEARVGMPVEFQAEHVHSIGTIRGKRVIHEQEQ